MVKKVIITIFFSIVIAVFVGFNYLLVQKENTDLNLGNLELEKTASSETIANQVRDITELKTANADLTEQIESLAEQDTLKSEAITSLEQAVGERDETLLQRNDLISKLKQNLNVELVGLQAREWIEAINNKEYDKAHSRFNKAIDNSFTTMLYSEFKTYYEERVALIEIKSMEVMTRGIPDRIDNDLVIVAVVDTITPQYLDSFNVLMEERRAALEAQEAAERVEEARRKAEEARIAADKAASEADAAEKAANEAEDEASGELPVDAQGTDSVGGQGVDSDGGQSTGGGVQGLSQNADGSLAALVLTGSQASPPPNNTSSPSGNTSSLPLDNNTQSPSDTPAPLEPSGSSDTSGGADAAGEDTESGANADGAGDTVGGGTEGSEANNADTDGTDADAAADGTGDTGDTGDTEEPLYDTAGKVLEVIRENIDEFPDEEFGDGIFNTGENQLFFLMNYKKEANDWEIVRIVQKL